MKFLLISLALIAALQFLSLYGVELSLCFGHCHYRG